MHQPASTLRTLRAARARVTLWAALAVSLGLLLPTGQAAAQSGYRVVHEFTGEKGTGRSPTGTLVQGADGKLYGAASLGGASRWGDVFRLSTRGAVKVMHSFRKDGPRLPAAGLTLSRDGNFYGTTSRSNVDASAGGSVFKMSPDGDVTILHEFDWRDGAGESPSRKLLEAADGNLYGTSSMNQSAYYAWRLAPGRTLDVIHEFTTQEGFQPSELIEGPDGHLYGVAASRGAHDSGTIFRMTLAGEVTVLHHFDRFGPHEGAAFPNSLMLAGDGNFYGTTAAGGRHANGTVFRMTPAGEVALIHEFTGGPTGGERPDSALLQASDGHFYGTTGEGGAHDRGVIYRLSPGGSIKVLRHFSPEADFGSSGALMQASDGRLYGMTRAGGSFNAGLVYSFKVD